MSQSIPRTHTYNYKTSLAVNGQLSLRCSMQTYHLINRTSITIKILTSFVRTARTLLSTGESQRQGSDHRQICDNDLQQI